MTNNHWAIYALRDIQNALSCEKYADAVVHIDDAIKALQKGATDETPSEDMSSISLRKW